MDDMMFKQAIRGFDKEEVLAYIRDQQSRHGQQILQMERDIRKRDKVISELKSRIVLKDEQLDRLENEIRTKYQKYIDNYNQIGELIYESRVRGDKIVADAHEKADQVLADADARARRRIAGVQGEIDAKLQDGKKKYLRVQDEMNEIVDLFNQMQRKFMQSYKEVHEIIQSMPASLDDIDLTDGDEETDDGLDRELLLDDALDADDFDDSDLDELLHLSINASDLDDDDDPEDFTAFSDKAPSDKEAGAAADGGPSGNAEETSGSGAAEETAASLAPETEEPAVSGETAPGGTAADGKTPEDEALTGAETASSGPEDGGADEKERLS